jgi:hypothetical protein
MTVKKSNFLLTQIPVISKRGEVLPIGLILFAVEVVTVQECGG